MWEPAANTICSLSENLCSPLRINREWGFLKSEQTIELLTTTFSSQDEHGLMHLERSVTCTFQLHFALLNLSPHPARLIGIIQYCNIHNVWPVIAVLDEAKTWNIYATYTTHLRKFKCNMSQKAEHLTLQSKSTFHGISPATGPVITEGRPIEICVTEYLKFN